MENFSCGERDDSMPRKDTWLPDGVFPGFHEACLEFYWDDIGGLQVEGTARPGCFIHPPFQDVPPVPGATIVNAEDFLQHLTKDQIRSAAHRVQAPPGIEYGGTPDRYSIAYFCSTS
ncbi:hypothetical protein OH77DRAFT_1590320 [Trametes cingulata]|nr:hypothetical protein OH77DRAFT_1590320 [Trametes cingulata]